MGWDGIKDIGLVWEEGGGTVVEFLSCFPVRDEMDFLCEDVMVY